MNLACSMNVIAAFSSIDSVAILPLVLGSLKSQRSANIDQPTDEFAKNAKGFIHADIE